MQIKGKVALVLGAVKGIGKGIGLALAKQGAALVLTRHDWEDEFESMENDFLSSNSEHLIITTDLRSVKDIKRLASHIKEKYGRLDILVNNIERGGWPVVHGEYTEDQWDLEIETTLKAKRWVFESVFDLLKNAKEAVVINISSIAGMVGRSGPAALVFNDGYAAANKGISSFTETWARLGAPNIRVNEIMLGVFDTRHARGTRGWQEVLTTDEKRSLIDHILLNRTGCVEDVVKACLFIIKDAPYMTGSILRLDGGYVLAGEKIPPMPKGIV
ncbi:SDR family NAD(P)-dependent oxidoreductase [Desulfobacula phenolica]|uniref:3-oxoacyl-[acyl-carrier protein] reductase n=1 Tax=Desulfobacula phenolica TaxID=90732 RepID=A0A1H2E1T2_9BACT|nr:SDR family oxidoreductase [Desulfobacula phenolica]SDT89015.1 3-oxoacyl-[acyl-carrier protein] reductase [Desulfobacula phenolica]